MLALVCSDSCHSLMSRYPLPTSTTNEVTVRVIFACVYVCGVCECVTLYLVRGRPPKASDARILSLEKFDEWGSRARLRGRRLCASSGEA